MTRYISRGGCQTHRQYPVHDNGYRVSHHCDTLDGNSSSLIFAADLRTVVGLHNTGGDQANLGIRMASLRQQSPIMRKVFKPVTPARPPTPSYRTVQLPAGFSCRINGSGMIELVATTKPIGKIETITYRNSVYLGEVKDGKPDGQGTVTWADGNIYVGAYKDGIRNGQGTTTFISGFMQSVLWRDDKFAD